MRLRCCVPHCRRTRKFTPIYSEWICGVHWRATSKHWRGRFHLFNRRHRQDLADRMWERLKAQAIERAAGIG